MKIQNKLKSIKDQKSYSSPAKRTMEHLKPILSKSSELQKRWMWELLQNASDLGDEVNTEFEISDTQLIFRHNGKPFKLEEAFNLIMPDSSKDGELLHSEAEENPPIGQFGTGFISTHILSKKVRVNGVIEDSDEGEFYKSSFLLDRTERKNKDFLIESIKNSEKEYGESLTKLPNYKPSEFDTEFIYDIDDTYASIVGSETIDIGLKTINDLLPFVFSFRHQLKKVRIKDFRNNKSEIITYNRKTVESDIEELQLIQTTRKVNGEKTDKTLIAKIEEGNTTVAVKVKNIEGNCYEIQEYLDDSPVLYCAFPMIGSDEFNFPAIIHSEYFVPNREREGIELNEYDEENRERLLEAKNAFFTLIDVIEEYKWDCSFHLFGLSKVDFSEDETNDWYKSEIYKPIYEKLRESNIVRTSEERDDEHSSFSKMYFPYIDKRKSDKYELLETLFNFSKELYSELLPIKSQFQKWYDKIDFDIFENEKLDLESLLDMISKNNQNLSDFENNYNTEASVDYLKKLMIFILIVKEENLLNDYKLVPNQNGDFCFQKKLKIDLVSDDVLPEEIEGKIKLIGTELTHEDCKVFLLHKSFESISELIDLDDNYELSELCSVIDDELRDFDGNFKDEEFLTNLKNLFQWYSKCGISEEDLSKLFPYFSLNKSQLYLNTKTPEELEYAFDIEISGKSQVLAKIAKSNLTEDELDIIAENPNLVSSFINWLNDKQEDNPDKELGNIGEEFLYYHLCEIFSKDRVLWEDKSEYDFRILDKDLVATKYFIDAKTTGKGIANSENVPFYMRTAQWGFLDKEQAFDKYLIARVFKNGSSFDVKYVKIDLIGLN